MNEGISQEEIDKLLQQAGNGAGSEKKDESKPPAFNLEDEKLAALFSSSHESVTSAISVVISKDITLKDQEIKSIEYADFEKEDLNNYVIAEIPFGGEHQGTNLLLLEKAFCSIATDIFLGGEGKEDREFNEETMDALKEIVNQIFGTLGTALTSGLGTDVSFELNEIKLHPDGFEKKEGDELTKMVHISYNMEIPELYQGKFIHIISHGTVEQFFEALVSQAPDSEPAVDSVTAEEGEGVEAEGATPQEAVYTPTEGPEEPNIELILDIELPLSVSLGETEMTIHEVLQLSTGSIIELNKSVEEPVDVIVNNKLIAKGEVVVLDSYFALRITEIVSHADRIKSLGQD